MAISKVFDATVYTVLSDHEECVTSIIVWSEDVLLHLRIFLLEPEYYSVEG